MSGENQSKSSDSKPGSSDAGDGGVKPSRGSFIPKSMQKPERKPKKPRGQKSGGQKGGGQRGPGDGDSSRTRDNHNGGGRGKSGSQRSGGGQHRTGGPRGSGTRGAGGQRGSGAQRGGGGHDQKSPLEVSSRITRNSLRRHAETIRDDESRLACRGVMAALVETGREVTSPAELLGVVEQTLHVLEAGTHHDHAQLPVALRGAALFAGETPKRQREVNEMLRRTLRHGYSLAADHIPRQVRDDGVFRAGALRDVLEHVAKEYMSDEAFLAHADN